MPQDSDLPSIDTASSEAGRLTRLYVGPKVFVVSLERAVSRRRAITSQLERLGVPFEFINAIDAKAVGRAHLIAQANEREMMRLDGLVLSDPEIACALSHRLVYQKIVDHQYDGALILEDDAHIVDGFLETLKFLEKSSKYISHLWQIYHLEALSRAYARNLVLRRRGALSVADGFEFRARMDFISFELNGTCAYYITRNAAQSMLKNATVPTIADRWSYYARQGRGVLYVAVPNTVVHPPEPEKSSIHLERYREASEYFRAQSFLRMKVRYLYYGIKKRVIWWLVEPICRFIPW